MALAGEYAEGVARCEVASEPVGKAKCVVHADVPGLAVFLFAELRWV